MSTILQRSYGINQSSRISYGCYLETYRPIGSRALSFSDPYYHRVSIASYANRWYSQRRNVRLSVCPSVCLSVNSGIVSKRRNDFIISSPSESLNILVSRSIWFITKFDRGHPERGRFMRLLWVRTGDFGDFSTNKPLYLRNGARWDQGCY